MGKPTHVQLRRKLFGWSNLATARLATQWLANTIRPDGYNGPQSMMPKGHLDALWKQMNASAVVWQAWQRTDQRRVRNNNVLLVARMTIHPGNSRNIGHSDRVSIARQSPFSTTTLKNKRFSNISGQCLIADIFSTPRPGPSNLFDGLIGPQFRAAD